MNSASGGTSTGHDEMLAEIRERRAELRESMSQVERALAAPYSADEASWTERVRAALLELADDFREHVVITEGTDGLYDELRQGAPRLTGAVARLTREHGDLSARLRDLLAYVEGEGLDVHELRRGGTDLLAVLMRHRQRGADLLYAAYELDIGGET